MEGRPNLAGLLSGSPGSSLSSHHSTEGCQEPDRRNQGAQKDVRELSVITGSPGSSLSSITAQKDVRNQTEGTREHRRMSGSTEGCQREPASSLYYYIYVIRSAKYHSFIESAIFHRFIVSAKYHRFFTLKRAKILILSRNTKTFQEKQKFFRFFLQVSKIVCIFAPSKVN